MRRLSTLLGLIAAATAGGEGRSFGSSPAAPRPPGLGPKPSRLRYRDFRPAQTPEQRDRALAKAEAKRQRRRERNREQIVRHARGQVISFQRWSFTADWPDVLPLRMTGEERAAWHEMMPLARVEEALVNQGFLPPRAA